MSGLVSAARANIRSFERVEKKFLLDGFSYEALMRHIGDQIVPDAFGVSDIHSVYLDTPSFLIVRRAQLKPVYKEKVRVRSYGRPSSPADGVFLEYKKKYKGIVYKRRVRMTVDECEAFIARRDWPASVAKDSSSFDGQIVREIGFALDRYENMGGLSPQMFISSQRLSFVGVDEPNLRLTFDENVLWRTHDVSIMAEKGGQNLLADSEKLLEVKAVGAMPKWLADALGSCGAHATPFSKYGNAYMALLREGRAIA